ncbi:FMN oxidoreductase [Pseudoclavibacter endophyticus]|uniref:NADH:flavin oxidoreductase/NADH oxidase n=1 Tax=Pseudoclavibacter endophyticus TaxID=1778590 RepID=A0A6H9WPV0_9MICO|nr:NADH:flavin oxidoreductase/NADH oxidase [Pseudoclavibacter endophyticus]KAB1650148.1 NADH:flavin oxidoreductase/NADH oxidase [Pseudoclavibacter endophyticus]GGA56755.1 FMN oxidoreductase [Pseudoclavibacter endophyticus]
MATPKLFAPLSLRDTTFRNRLWVSPMCQYACDAEDGRATDWHLVHYPGFARGGAGLVIVEATAVTPEGRISPRDLGIWSDGHVEGLSRIASLVKGLGAAAAIQLAHAGRKASTPPMLPGFERGRGSVPESDGGWRAVAPSALAFGDYDTPRELAAEELPGIVNAFVTAAERAVRAGFDAVEVHAAHGYLLHEFLSPLSNAREDEYGGDLAGRARLVREVVRGIRAAHPDLPVFVRVSATDWVDGGITAHDTATVSGWLREDGADFIDVSSGANTPDAQIPVGPAYQAPLAAVVRAAGLPVGTVGMITQSWQAETLLTTEQADVVIVAREWLRDPNLALTWAGELRADVAAIRPPQLFRAIR